MKSILALTLKDTVLVPQNTGGQWRVPPVAAGQRSLDFYRLVETETMKIV